MVTNYIFGLICVSTYAYLAFRAGIYGDFIMIRVTRKEKRTKESKINFFAEFIKIQKHFFSDFTKKLREVKEIRKKSCS